MIADPCACVRAVCLAAPAAVFAGDEEPPISICGIIDVAVSSQDSRRPTLASNHSRANRAGGIPRFARWEFGANQRFGSHHAFANPPGNRLADGARGGTVSLAWAHFLSGCTRRHATAAVRCHNDRAVFGLGGASSAPAAARGAGLCAPALGIPHTF